MLDSKPSAGRAASERTAWSRGLLVLCGLIFAAAVAYAVAYHLSVRVLPFDDAFISYRYVANLAAGNGPVYNVGERVFGSSAPGYVAWLTLLKLILPAIDAPVLAVRGNALFYVATALCVLLILRQLLRRDAAALMLAALFTINPFMLAISSGGMESFLFASLALGSLAALFGRRLRLAAGLAGLAAVTRPEGLLAVGIVALYWLIADRRRDLALPALAFGPFLLWLIFATAYFGTPVPHSILAKNRPLYLLPPAFAYREMLGQLATWSGARVWGLPDTRTALWLLPAAVGAAFLLRPTLLRQIPGWSLPLSFVVLFAFYAQSNTLMFDWYYPLIIALWFILVAGGPLSYFRGEAFAARGAPFARYGAGALAAVAVVLVAAHPLAGSLSLWRSGRLGPDIATPDRLRIETYRTAAENLNASARPGATVAGPEVGALGYYYRGHVYDAAGLVSPQALPFMPVPLRERTSGVAGSISAAFVESTQPDYVVSMPTFSSRSIDVNGWFLSRYRLLAALPLPADLWESREVLVYGKNPEAAPEVMNPADADWTDAVRLARYSIAESIAPGDPLTVTLVWTPQGAPTKSWKVFVHLLDERDGRVAQDDSVPDQGRAPTDTWRAGEVILDAHVLRPAAPLAPGEYRIAVGLYDEATGARLPRNDGSDVFIAPRPLVVAD